LLSAMSAAKLVRGGIDGFVKVSQLGAPLSDVANQFLILWGLSALYGCIAIILEREGVALTRGRCLLLAQRRP
jgi:hypothetical protein